MERYSDEELEEAGYFCKDCGGHPCNCEFIQAYQKYGDIICDDKSKLLVDDLYNFKDKLDNLNKDIDELLKKYEEKIKYITIMDKNSLEAIGKHTQYYKEIVQDLKNLKGE